MNDDLKKKLQAMDEESIKTLFDEKRYFPDKKELGKKEYKKQLGKQSSKDIDPERFPETWIDYIDIYPEAAKLAEEFLNENFDKREAEWVRLIKGAPTVKLTFGVTVIIGILGYYFTSGELFKPIPINLITRIVMGVFSCCAMLFLCLEHCNALMWGRDKFNYAPEKMLSDIWFLILKDRDMTDDRAVEKLRIAINHYKYINSINFRTESAKKYRFYENILVTQFTCILIFIVMFLCLHSLVHLKETSNTTQSHQSTETPAQTLKK